MKCSYLNCHLHFWDKTLHKGHESRDKLRQDSRRDAATNARLWIANSGSPIALRVKYKDIDIT